MANLYHFYSFVSLFKKKIQCPEHKDCRHFITLLELEIARNLRDAVIIMGYMYKFMNDTDDCRINV